jgi:hypothetical protein
VSRSTSWVSVSAWGSTTCWLMSRSGRLPSTCRELTGGCMRARAVGGGVMRLPGPCRVQGTCLPPPQHPPSLLPECLHRPPSPCVYLHLLSWPPCFTPACCPPSLPLPGSPPRPRPSPVGTTLQPACCCNPRPLAFSPALPPPPPRPSPVCTALPGPQWCSGATPAAAPWRREGSRRAGAGCLQRSAPGTAGDARQTAAGGHTTPPGAAAGCGGR